MTMTAVLPTNAHGRRSRGRRCDDCRMHLDLCVCTLIHPVATRTRVILILHQLEERKPTNTGRIAIRCLSNSTTVPRGRTPTNVVPDWLAGASNPLLLFPRTDARPIEQWRGCPDPMTLIVPDGTWQQTLRTHRRVPGLAALPCASLPPGAASAYRLRQDPRAERLCTLEAIARALGVLDGPEIQQRLEGILRVVVERTLWCRGRLPAALVTGGVPPAALARARRGPA